MKLFLSVIFDNIEFPVSRRLSIATLRKVIHTGYVQLNHIEPVVLFSNRFCSHTSRDFYMCRKVKFFGYKYITSHQLKDIRNRTIDQFKASKRVDNSVKSPTK